jgi:hypothetical protein
MHTLRVLNADEPRIAVIKFNLVDQNGMNANESTKNPKLIIEDHSKSYRRLFPGYVNTLTLLDGYRKLNKLFKQQQNSAGLADFLFVFPNGFYVFFPPCLLVGYGVGV